MKKSLFFTAVLFFGMCLAYAIAILLRTENHFVYNLDDAYIHLAMAKNFVFHGVWGITKYTFSSSSSSPAFTLMLSGLIAVFGDHELVPLIFNILCSFLIIYFLDRYYTGFFSKDRSIVTATVFTLLFTSVSLLIFSGMEHVLQVLVVVINIFYFNRWLKSDFKDSVSSAWFYGTLVFLGLIRFESIFYFSAFAFVFFLLKRSKEGIGVLVFGFIPVLIFGYFTYHETGYFFPNSVMVKGTKLNLSGNYIEQIKNIVVNKILFNPYFLFAGMFPLLIAGTLIFKDCKNKLGFHALVLNNFLLIVFGLIFFMHGAFGQFTNFFRYEAYILVIFAMAVISRLKVLFVNKNYLLKENRILFFLVLFSSGLMIFKMNLVSQLIVTGSENIYEQQIQSAEFLKKYYNNFKVVANDIGAICYFTDIHLLDVAGLGSKEIVPFKVKKDGLDDKFEKFLTNYSSRNHYQLAIIYDEWLKGHVPKSWKKIAVLRIKGANAVLGKDHLSIYAVDISISSSLRQNIKDFNWNKNVEVKIVE